jgi:hypothetical protein
LNLKSTLEPVVQYFNGALTRGKRTEQMLVSGNRKQDQNLQEGLSTAAVNSKSYDSRTGGSEVAIGCVCGGISPSEKSFISAPLAVATLMNVHGTAGVHDVHHHSVYVAIEGRGWAEARDLDRFRCAKPVHHLKPLGSDSASQQSV